jgi:hypothetical protein
MHPAHQTMDPLHKEFPEPLLKHMHHHSLAIFTQPESTELQHFLDQLADHIC